MVAIAIIYSHLYDGANVANPSDEKGDSLEEEVDKVVVLAVNKIIASTQEKKCGKSQLQCVESVKTRTKTRCILKESLRMFIHRKVHILDEDV